MIYQKLYIGFIDVFYDVAKNLTLAFFWTLFKCGLVSMWSFKNDMTISITAAEVWTCMPGFVTLTLIQGHRGHQKGNAVSCIFFSPYCIVNEHTAPQGCEPCRGVPHFQVFYCGSSIAWLPSSIKPLILGFTLL